MGGEVFSDGVVRFSVPAVWPLLLLLLSQTDLTERSSLEARVPPDEVR